MRNGFSKIPNYLADLPLSIAEIGLYSWLSLHADKNGNVSLSLNDITRMTGLNKMQVRRFLEKLKANKLVTQQATHKATHLPSVTTICYLGSYKKEKAASDTATDTATDTLRAYKNDLFYNQSIQEEEKRNNLSDDKFKEKFGNYDFSFVAEDMAETFFRWLSYRKELKKPFNTQSSLRTNYNKLMKLADNSPEQARLIVEQSIANQWQGLFHIIEENQKKGNYSVGQILRDNSADKYLNDAKWK